MLLTLRIASLQHEVGPVAVVAPLVVGQARSAGDLLGCSVGALAVVGLAGTDGEDAEIVLAGTSFVGNDCNKNYVSK